MMSTNLYSSFLFALAAAATAVVTGCAVGDAADAANAPEPSLESVSLPCNELTPPEDYEQPSGYTSGQRAGENPYQRASGEERASSPCSSEGYSRGSKGRSEIGDEAPQGSYGQLQQGQDEQPQRGQYKQPRQGQYEQPQQGQFEQPQQGQFEEPQQGQDEGCQGQEPAGAYDDPGPGVEPIPVPYAPVVTYPVFYPVYFAYAVPACGAFYGYPCGGALLASRFWGGIF